MDAAAITAALTWAQEHLEVRVTSVAPLEGGRTSTMLALGDGIPSVAVLRLVTEEPWRSHGRELVVREALTQRTLAQVPGLPAPRSLAVDPDATRTGHPAHLMTRVPGRADDLRCDDDALVAMAELLAAIHSVRSTPPPRGFQSWAWPAKWVVPTWTSRPEIWQRAFEVLAGDRPGFEPTFLHRDFGPHNLLWTGDDVTGVVDWVETSTGPAWLDVAHCASNFALRHGTAVGQRFAAAYAHVTGVEPQAYWDVMDVVGYLPPPGRAPMFDDPAQWTRLEDHLAWALR